MIQQTKPESVGDVLTLEEPAKYSNAPRRVSLGFPSGLPFGERRFPITPEGAEQLVDRGYRLVVEAGAGEPIHYDDSAYARAGVEIADRTETLRADIIVSLAPLAPGEAAGMRRGTLLLTLLHSVIDNANYARALQQAGVNAVAADIIATEGHRPVADILHEIDGCASLAVANALLTDPVAGKGILLGGVTGIVPCETTVIGSGMGAIAAAHNALGAGGIVRMFDDDLYSLRKAGRVLNHRPIGSAIHPRVLRSALRSADVVVVTPTKYPVRIDSETVSEMKKRVLIFDLTNTPGAMFPSVDLVDLAREGGRPLTAPAGRTVFCNVGCRVPRTAAMALSNVLTAHIDTLAEAMDSIARMSAGMRGAMLLCWGKVVNPLLADVLDTRSLDINLLTEN